MDELLSFNDNVSVLFCSNQAEGFCDNAVTVVYSDFGRPLCFFDGLGLLFSRGLIFGGKFNTFVEAPVKKKF